MQHFKDVTLLITHYNRSSSLERLLKSCSDLEYAFDDIVVSDDGSKSEHLSRLGELQQQYPFRLITTPQNRGLGNNINKGQDAVTTPYTLYVQEDFIPYPVFGGHFQDALDMIRAEDDIDIIRFYSYIKYPYLKPYKKGFSEMIIKRTGWDYLKIYFYSDHPHLRRSSFLQKFGRYNEHLSGDKTEYQMCVSVFQKASRGLFFDDYKGLFEQYNPASEPSTMTRANWTQSRNPVIAFVRDVYRQLKYNYDIHFLKTGNH